MHLFFVNFRFLLDPASALRHVDPRVADVLFILTITNSVVNPYVYGSYASEMRTKCLSWFGLGGLAGRNRRGGGTGSNDNAGRRNNSDQNTVLGLAPRNGFVGSMGNYWTNNS